MKNRVYQISTGCESAVEDEYSYAAAKKGNWVLYPKIPRYTIETPPFLWPKAHESTSALDRGRV